MNISNQNLEHQIAMVYVDAAKWYPGQKVEEAGILADMWAEFDKRSEAGTIDDE